MLSVLLRGGGELSGPRVGVNTGRSHCAGNGSGYPLRLRVSRGQGRHDGEHAARFLDCESGFPEEPWPLRRRLCPGRGFQTFLPPPAVGASSLSSDSAQGKLPASCCVRPCLRCQPALQTTPNRPPPQPPPVPVPSPASLFTFPGGGREPRPEPHGGHLELPQRPSPRQEMALPPSRSTCLVLLHRSQERGVHPSTVQREPRPWRSWAFGRAPGVCGPPVASSLIRNVLVGEKDPPKERQEGRGGKLGARRPACPGSSYPAARAPQNTAPPRTPEPWREHRRPRSHQDAAGRSRACYGYIEFHENEPLTSAPSAGTLSGSDIQYSNQDRRQLPVD